MTWEHCVAAFVAAFIVSEIAIFDTTIYLHRYVTHGSISRLSPPVRLVCRTICWITTGQRPREWAAVHLSHHGGLDTLDDPHSPKILGFWRVQLGNVGLYRRAAKDPRVLGRYAITRAKHDQLDKWFFDRAWLGLAIGITILVVIMWALGLGLLTGFLAAGIHAVMYVMLAASINAVTHVSREFTFGKQPYANSATNLKWWAYLTAGEALHNNHHQSPGSAHFTLGNEGEHDPAWPIIRLLVKAGLADTLYDGGVRPQDLPEAA